MPTAPNPVPDLSVIVPCYNEEAAVGPTIDTLVEHLAEHMASKGTYELIVVDDGSTDGSADVLARAVARHDTVKVVTHDRNRGYGAALKSGLRHARAELVAITDADGTYPNERLGELVRLAEHADMVVGARNADDALRRIPKLFLRAYCSWLVGRPIPDMNSGLRVFRKSIGERFMKILPDSFSFTTTLTVAMMRNRYHVEFVPISYATRVGRSKLKPIRDTLRFVQLIVRTGMYFAPLRVLAPVVVLLSLAFLASLAYDIVALGNLTDKTIILLLFAMNTALFALLADMIDKRSPE